LGALATVVLVAAGLLLITPSGSVAAADSKCNRTNNTIKKLLECVTVEGVLEHEQALQDIADHNGGNRASGTSGYDASLDYVQSRLTRAGYTVSRQTFDFHKFTEVGAHVLQQTAPNPTVYVQDTDFDVTPQSEPGDVTAAVSAVDINLVPPR